VDETEEEARMWGSKLVYTFGLLAAHFTGVSAIYPSPAYKVPGLLFALRREQEQRSSPTAAGSGDGSVIREGMAIGTPETVIKNLKMWEEIGVDRMVFLLNAGEVIPQEKVLRSLRLFAEHVLPKFDPEAARARAGNGKASTSR
jgi:alkanesulfonate monooxygenase SsuD/methylene tetrahydromethanopterin reductase-like flavin-dependent oxidoreductase (luciferase family)